MNALHKYCLENSILRCNSPSALKSNKRRDLATILKSRARSRGRVSTNQTSETKIWCRNLYVLMLIKKETKNGGRTFTRRLRHEYKYSIAACTTHDISQNVYNWSKELKNHCGISLLPVNNLNSNTFKCGTSFRIRGNKEPDHLK